MKSAKNPQKLPSLRARQQAVGLKVVEIARAVGLHRMHVHRVLRGEQCSIRSLRAVEAEIVKAEAEFVRRFTAAQRQKRQEGWPDAADQ